MKLDRKVHIEDREWKYSIGKQDDIYISDGCRVVKLHAGYIESAFVDELHVKFPELDDSEINVAIYAITPGVIRKYIMLEMLDKETGRIDAHFEGEEH